MDADRYLRSLELFGMRFGLDRMQRLLTVLDSPQRRYATVHVVGTNGKTSTAQMIAALLSAHDLRTGTYISPDLTGFAERVQVDGRPVPAERFARSVARVAHAAELVNRTTGPDDVVTQFEALTAAAFLGLAEAGVEVAAIEAGLGGRFDATNVTDSSVQVLTSVGLEHTRWLGPTERHIAGEKLAVVPHGGRLVSGPLGSDALACAEEVVRSRGVRHYLAGRDFHWHEQAGSLSVEADARYDRIRLRPLGGFQRRNFAVAVCAAEVFLGGLDEARVRTAAAQLEIPGRLEVVGERPLTLFDGAHNVTGMRELVASLGSIVGERSLVACFAVLDDKEAAAMLELLLPLCRAAVFTRSSNRRSLPPATLGSLAEKVGCPSFELEGNGVAALARSRELAGADGAVLATGSIYLLSDLVRNMRHRDASRSIPETGSR